MVRRGSSPRPTFAEPQVSATRLIPSVVPRVKMISEGLAAFTKRTAAARAASYWDAARRASVCSRGDGFALSAA